MGKHQGNYKLKHKLIKLMVSIEHPIICDREEHFKPDEIRALIFAVTEYNIPIAPDCKEYANLEFNKRVT